MRSFLLLLALFLPACTTTYYPNGKKALVVGSNIRGMVFTAPGISLRGDLDNSTVHNAVGNTVIKTSGLVAPLLLP